MSSSIKISTSSSRSSGGEINDPDELRRGPWTMEEDALLVHYIARHGEGRWNLLAKRSGLKRNGKSCRLRWLNYLKPDVKRGNLTPQEQMSILELHSKWGNRWSKIAQHLPGRTDNEIKNYWRTRVQKQARHLKIDANSKAFQDVIRCFWIPRLLQKIDGSSSSSSQNSTVPNQPSFDQTFQHYSSSPLAQLSLTPPKVAAFQEPYISSQAQAQAHRFDRQELNSDSEHGTNNSCISSSESINFSQISHLSDYPTSPFHVTSSCCSDRYTTFAKDFYDHVNNSTTSTCCDMGPINLQATMEPAHGDFSINQVHNNFQMEDNNWVEYDLAAASADDGIWNMAYELWQLKNSLPT